MTDENDPSNGDRIPAGAPDFDGPGPGNESTDDHERSDFLPNFIRERSAHLTRVGAAGLTAGVAMIPIAQPVMAQTAIEEAGGLVCEGQLGSAIFLGFGILALVLFLLGAAQTALGFKDRGGKSGTGRGGGGDGIKNGLWTMFGGLFLGMISALLAYFGVDVSACLGGDGGGIITVMPYAYDVVLALI